MTRKQSGSAIRYRSKHARDICKAVRAAGGTVAVTANGHLLVRGPGGLATVGSSGDSWRATANAVSTIKRCAGLDVRGVS